MSAIRAASVLSRLSRVAGSGQSRSAAAVGARPGPGTEASDERLSHRLVSSHASRVSARKGTHAQVHALALALRETTPTVTIGCGLEVMDRG